MTRHVRMMLWACVAAAGLLVRAYWLSQGPSIQGDAAGRYIPEAMRILSGNDPSRVRLEAMEYNPGYPYFLVLIFMVFGPSFWAVAVIQAGIELTTIAMSARLAARVTDSKAGRTAWALGLSCPFLALFSRILLSETLATFVALSTVYSFVALTQTASLRWAVAAGLALGAALTIRADFLPLALLLPSCALGVGWHAGRRRSRDVAILVLVPMTLVGLMMLPTAIRNHRLSGRWAPMGPASAQVTHPYARWLDTWLDDPRQFPRAWWHVLADEEAPFSDLPDDQRQPALAAVGQARAAASEPLSACKPPTACFLDALGGPRASAFVDLRERAISEDPVRSRVLIPMVRTARTWALLPGYLADGPWKLVAYVSWAATLALALWGVVVLAQRDAGSCLMIGALVLARTVLPLSTALAVEPRYMLPALPAILVFGGVALARMLEASPGWSPRNSPEPGVPIEP